MGTNKIEKYMIKFFREIRQNLLNQVLCRTMPANGLAMSSSVPQGAIAYRFCWQLTFIFLSFFLLVLLRHKLKPRFSCQSIRLCNNGQVLVPILRNHFSLSRQR